MGNKEDFNGEPMVKNLKGKLYSIKKMMKAIPIALLLLATVSGVTGCSASTIVQDELDGRRYINLTDNEELRQLLGIEEAPTFQECLDEIKENTNLTEDEKKKVICVLEDLNNDSNGKMDFTVAYLNCKDIKFQYGANEFAYSSKNNCIYCKNEENQRALDEEIGHALQDIYYINLDTVVGYKQHQQLDQVLDCYNTYGNGLIEGYRQLFVNMNNDNGQWILDDNKNDYMYIYYGEIEDIAYVLDYILEEYDAVDFENGSIKGLKEAMLNYGFTEEEAMQIFNYTDTIERGNSKRKEVLKIIFSRYAQKEIEEGKNPIDIWCEINNIMNSSYIGQMSTITGGSKNANKNAKEVYKQEEMKEYIKDSIRSVYEQNGIEMPDVLWDATGEFIKHFNSFSDEENYLGFVGKNGINYVYEDKMYAEQNDETASDYDIFNFSEMYGLSEEDVREEISTIDDNFEYYFQQFKEKKESESKASSNASYGITNFITNAVNEQELT